MRKVVAAVAAVLLVLVVVGALTGDDDTSPPKADGTTDVAELGVASADADCTPVQHVQPVPEGPPHENGTLTWSQVPPDHGVHNARTLRALTRFYERSDEPAPEQAVHDLEHGLVVVWYDDELPDDEVDALREVAVAMPLNRFVVVPWNRSTFADGRHVVLTAWGHTQRCRRVSGQVAYDFIRTYADKDAPEKGAPV